LGDEAFVHDIAHRIGCQWKRGRPSKMSTLTPQERAAQFSLFRSPIPPKEKAGTGLTRFPKTTHGALFDPLLFRYRHTASFSQPGGIVVSVTGTARSVH
jgi:hypothetical protein